MPGCPKWDVRTVAAPIEAGTAAVSGLSHGQSRESSAFAGGEDVRGELEAGKHIVLYDAIDLFGARSFGAR